VLHVLSSMGLICRVNAGHVLLPYLSVWSVQLWMHATHVRSFTGLQERISVRNVRSLFLAASTVLKHQCACNVKSFMG
jgi:hypothetical protein